MADFWKKSGLHLHNADELVKAYFAESPDLLLQNAKWLHAQYEILKIFVEGSIHLQCLFSSFCFVVVAGSPTRRRFDFPDYSHWIRSRFYYQPFCQYFLWYTFVVQKKAE